MTDRTCAVDGCDKPLKCKGYCIAHYTRLRRTGDVGSPDLERRGEPAPNCIVDGCGIEAVAKGMCYNHRRRTRRHGDPTYVSPNTGENNHCYRGDEIGIGAAHYRVTVKYGRAADHRCLCGEVAQHWAYDHLDPDEKQSTYRGLTMPYSVDPDHYRAMCVPCHKRFDLDYLSSQSNGMARTAYSK